MDKKPDNRILWRYAGMATQFLVAIGIAVFGGLKIDEWLKLKMPLAVWVLPLLVIVVVIIKIMKDTSGKNRS